MTALPQRHIDLRNAARRSPHGIVIGLLEALREPTDYMVDHVGEPQSLSVPEMIKEEWRDMIDAAIEEIRIVS